MVTDSGLILSQTQIPVGRLQVMQRDVGPPTGGASAIARLGPPCSRRRALAPPSTRSRADAHRTVRSSTWLTSPLTPPRVTTQATCTQMRVPTARFAGIVRVIEATPLASVRA